MSAEMSAPKPVMVKPDSIPALEPPSSLEAESDQNVAESRYENMQVSYKNPPPRPNNPRPRRKGPSVDEVHQETNRRSGDSTYKETFIDLSTFLYPVTLYLVTNLKLLMFYNRLQKTYTQRCILCCDHASRKYLI